MVTNIENILESDFRKLSIDSLAEKIFLQFCIDSKHDQDDYAEYLARRAIDYSRIFRTELDKYHETQD